MILTGMRLLKGGVMKINQKLRGLLLFLGSIGILDTLLLFLSNGGINLGTILPGVLGGMLILLVVVRELFWKSILLRKDRPWVIRLRQGIISLFLIGLISFLVIEGRSLPILAQIQLSRWII